MLYSPVTQKDANNDLEEVSDFISAHKSSIEGMDSELDYDSQCHGTN